MRRACLAQAVLGTTVFMVVPCVALLAGPARAADAPVAFRQLHEDIVVQPDGRAVETIHMAVAAGNDGGARNIAQQTLPYIDGLERVELLDGFTMKADGRRLPVGEGAVRQQLAPGSPNLPQYSDLKRVVAVFPDVQAGDSVELTWRKTILQPLFPGQFTQSSIFNPVYPWQDVRISITAPRDRSLQTQAFGPALQVTEEGDLRHYTWTYAAPAAVEDRSVISPLDRFPRLFASSFADWPEFGSAWAALVEPKLAVSPHIQALADALTAGRTDPRAQTEAIYNWVSRHIRWVALYVGNGSYVPHAAEEVLTDGYGDCKDQVVLTMALLRAKGITAEPALINAGSSYAVSGPPTLSAFNHVITYVPGLDLYMDTTTEGAPFGTLPSILYGKPVLHVRLAGSELGRIPALPSGVAIARTYTSAALGADGRVTGRTVSEGVGPFATKLRGIAQQLQGVGTERGAAEQLRRLGQSGTGDLELGTLAEIGADYRTVGRFELNPQPDWLDGEPFQIPAGLVLLPRPGDGALGPLGVRNLSRNDPTPCYAGEQHEDLALTLPPGRRPDHLPRDRRIENADFTFTSHWSFADGTLSVQRDLVSHIAQPLCEGKLREEAARALTAIRNDLDAQVSLEE